MEVTVFDLQMEQKKMRQEAEEDVAKCCQMVMLNHLCQTVNVNDFSLYLCCLQYCSNPR